MKITDVQTLLLRFPEGGSYSDAQHHFGKRAGVVIRLATDAQITGHGYVGLGVSAEAATAIKLLIDRQFAPVLVGADPFLPRRLRELMTHEIEYVGVEGIAHFTLTGLDTALWDIMARALGVPGWKLLGACRDRIPAYAMVGWYYDDDVQLDRFKQAISRAMEDGMPGVKIKVARGTPGRGYTAHRGGPFDCR